MTNAQSMAGLTLTPALSRKAGEGERRQASSMAGLSCRQKAPAC